MDLLYRAQHSHTKRLAIFYLFNDIIQYAARDHKIDYLEEGSSIFIPVVSQYLEGCAPKDKVPFVRTLTIWAERHVLSKRFVEKLKIQWESQVQAPVSQSVSMPPDETMNEPSAEPRKPVLSGDPKMFNLDVISERLNQQQKSNSAILAELKKVMLSDDACYHDATMQSSLGRGDQIRALSASLTAELNVCGNCMMPF